VWLHCLYLCLLQRSCTLTHESYDGAVFAHAAAHVLQVFVLVHSSTIIRSDTLVGACVVSAGDRGHLLAQGGTEHHHAD
jgi:hypothetical protein